MTLESILAIVFPIIGLVAGSVVTALFLRRSSKEENDTNAFKVVTDQLFALNEDLREDLTNVKKQVAVLETTVATQATELRTVQAERDSLKEVNGQLSRYLGKLVRLWPRGEHLPEPDEDVTWTV